MKAKGVNRVIIAVKDIDEATKRYSDLLGISFWDAGIQEEYGVHASISWEGGLELIMPLDSNSAIAKYLDRHGEGLYGVAFKVTDIDRAATAAKDKNVRITGEIDEDQSGRFHMYRELVLHPADTGGILMLLVQTKPK